MLHAPFQCHSADLILRGAKQSQRCIRFKIFLILDGLRSSDRLQSKKGRRTLFTMTSSVDQLLIHTHFEESAAQHRHQLETHLSSIEID